MTEAKKRCRTCWRTGHTARAHSGLTNAELEQVKAEGREFMARGFRELGEQAADGDLFDVLRADTERAIVAATVATGSGDPGPLFARADGAITGGMPGWSVDHTDPPLAPTSAEAPDEEEPLVWDRTEHECEPSPEQVYYCWHCGADLMSEDSPCPVHGPSARSAGLGEPDYSFTLTGEFDRAALSRAALTFVGVMRPEIGEQGPQFAPWRTVFGPDGPKLITLPGVYDLEAAEYHDPQVTGDWLSNSDARQLIGKGCPAQFRYDKDNGVREENDAFAMGHAVHARILGKGEKIAVRPLVNPKDPEQAWDSWRTKASQQWRREQEAAGRSVIIPEQAEVVEAMAVAVHSKPDAHRLLSQPGRPEMSLFWVDPETGVRRRAMVDYLPSVVDEYGVMEPVDIKSADEVAPNEDMERKLYNHAWHRQGTTIADGIVALGLAAEVSFHFVVQSKKAPHLVTVVKLDAEAERIGHIENREALHVYKRCLETDEWPDFTPEGPVTMTVPVWVARLYEEDIR